MIFRPQLRIGIGCVVIAAAYGQVPLDTSGNLSTIDVNVVDSFGHELAGASLYIQRLTPEGPGNKVKLEGHQVKTLQHGRYLLTAEKPNFASASTEVRLHDPWATVTIALVPYAILASENFITVIAKLHSPAPPECQRVRFLPLFAVGPTFDAKVISDRFTITDVKPGTYVAVFASPERVCHIAEVTVPLGEQIVSIVIP